MKYVVCLHLYIPCKFGERGSTPLGATWPSLSVFLSVCPSRYDGRHRKPRRYVYALNLGGRAEAPRTKVPPGKRPPGQKTPRTKAPPDKNPPGQKSPGQKCPREKDPGEKSPRAKDPPGKRSPGQKPPTPPKSAQRRHILLQR